jgi:hypothetical protein
VIGHYTTHNGRLHHFPFGPGIEEQATGDRSYLVATGPEAFDGGKIVAVGRRGPGVCHVVVLFGPAGHWRQCRTIFSKDEFLPEGVVCD